jgi:hypothetical protein
LDENTKMTNSLKGNELVYLMRQNRVLLVKRYPRDNVQIADNLECISIKEYVDLK